MILWWFSLFHRTCWTLETLVQFSGGLLDLIPKMLLLQFPYYNSQNRSLKEMTHSLEISVQLHNTQNQISSSPLALKSSCVFAHSFPAAAVICLSPAPAREPSEATNQKKSLSYSCVTSVSLCVPSAGSHPKCHPGRRSSSGYLCWPGNPPFFCHVHWGHCWNCLCPWIPVPHCEYWGPSSAPILSFLFGFPGVPLVCYKGRIDTANSR